LVRADLSRWASANPRRKDAIIERFDLDRQSFQPFLEDHGDRLSIVVPDQPGDRENRRALGFIQYEKEAGRITIANPCMQLPIDALAMGFSTKAAHKHLVGRHGEGLKLAGLVLARDRYQVNVAASGCNWRFDMHTDASSISCTVAPSQKTKLIGWTDPALDMANLRYRVGRDVAVVIGRARTKPGRPVALDVFLDWLRLTTMDIRGLTYPSGLIPTPHGDLILDPQLRGQLDHNGITLTNSTVGGAFLFAYNFAYSSTCRDRRRLASWRDAARQVRQIWEEALREKEDTVLPLLVDLLRKQAHSADAEMIGPHLEPSARRQIWQYLLRESADKEFFYSERSNDQVCACGSHRVTFG
jgi:hypothetical protein